MSDWKWLEEIELENKGREDQWDDLSSASDVPQLIDCIKTMRAGIEEEIEFQDEGRRLSALLTRCAEGKFNE